MSLVEHTSINPNKAAHIGHLRNAILGDTFVRLLRAAGQQVDVQNYIDNTGVQVADVVVGFLHLEGKSLAEVRALIAESESALRAERALRRRDRLLLLGPLRAHLAVVRARAPKRKRPRASSLRYDTLHAIEQGGNETAEVAELISTAVLRRHLETMLRLDIEYDFLPRESEILHLKFWDAGLRAAQEDRRALLRNRGQEQGLLGDDAARRADETGPSTRDGEDPDEDAKVIVRSNGTVTYVGKDIAYHLWKFGLLGRDFGYKTFFTLSRSRVLDLGGARRRRSSALRRRARRSTT